MEAEHTTAAGTVGLDNSQAFFDSVHESGIFESILKPDQVKGLAVVMGAARTDGWPFAFTACLYAGDGLSRDRLHNAAGARSLLAQRELAAHESALLSLLRAGLRPAHLEG